MVLRLLTYGLEPESTAENRLPGKCDYAICHGLKNSKGSLAFC